MCAERPPALAGASGLLLLRSQPAMAVRAARLCRPQAFGEMPRISTSNVVPDPACLVAVDHHEGDAEVGDLQDTAVSQTVAFLVGESVCEVVEHGSGK